MPPFLKKGFSRIHGKGIYTTRAIKKSELFYIVPTDKISKIPKKRFAKIENYWINDPAILNWINHSCNPNTELVIRKNKSPRLRALRKISPNEEITVDYNKTETGGKKIPCSCKGEECKGYFLRVE